MRSVGWFFGAGISRVVMLVVGCLVEGLLTRAADAHVEICQRKVRYDC